jgi:hypothetical protein
MNSADKMQLAAGASAAMQMRNGLAESLGVEGFYTAVCRGADGVIKWEENFFNTVMTLGKNDILDKYLKGAAYTQTIVMGLKGTGSQVAGDTQASHAGWLEVGLANAPTYTGNRKAVTMGSASAGSSVSPGQVFAITGTGTVAGCFINNGGSATKDDTTGVLFSAGDFGTSRSVISGDSITVTYTLSV